MAMTFTLVSHLREQLSTLVRARADKLRREEAEKERLALEVLPSIHAQIQIVDIHVPRRRRLELGGPLLLLNRSKRGR